MKTQIATRKIRFFLKGLESDVEVMLCCAKN